MRLIFPVLALSVISIMIVSCKSDSKTSSQKADVLLVNMDTTVSPGEDFFQYANGGWINKNPIPAEQSSWGIGNLVIDSISTTGSIGWWPTNRLDIQDY